MAITMLAGYLVIINAAALLMMAEDKRRAKWHQWRVPEAALFGTALLGGSAAIAGGVRYLLVVLFAGCVWPLTFWWFGRLGRR